jgi:hypothetical protein
MGKKHEKSKFPQAPVERSSHHTRSGGDAHRARNGTALATRAPIL